MAIPSHLCGLILVVVVVLQRTCSISSNMHREQFDCGHELNCRCSQEHFYWGDDAEHHTEKRSANNSSDSYAYESLNDSDTDYYDYQSSAHNFRNVLIDCKHLNFNKIPHTIPSNATNIILSYNNIAHLSKKPLAHCHITEELDISYNAITRVDRDAFVHMPLLHILRLDHNSIEHLPSECFSNMSNLFVLDLSHNKLKHVPAFPGDSIFFLQLEFNELQELSLDDLTCGGQPHFLIDVSRNKLTTVPVSLARSLMTYYDACSGGIILDGNPWVCDCHILPLKNVWPHQPHYLYETIFCDTPATLTGRSIWNIPDNEFVCTNTTAVAQDQDSVNTTTNPTIVQKGNSKCETEAAIVGVAIGCLILGSVLSLMVVFVAYIVRSKLKHRRESDTLPYIGMDESQIHESPEN